jgi:hypothetical protein
MRARQSRRQNFRAQLCGTGTTLIEVAISTDTFPLLDLKGAKSQAMLVSMKSALRVIVGVSILATAVGCDNGGDAPENSGGAIAVGGKPSTAGTSSTAGATVIPGGGTTGTAGAGGGGTLTDGVPLTVMDGWVDGMGNTLKVQGAMFQYADPTSLAGPPAMTFDFMGTHACIKGTAAKVDMKSMACTTKMFTPPAVDCYGEYWGAAIGLNMNQAIDPMTMMGGPAMPYDASAIKGFSFTISGATIPTSLRFKAEDATGEYCTPATVPVKMGANTINLSQLIKECWAPKAGAATADSAKAGLVKIAWQVVTNATAAIPFDYCVEDLRAVQ